MYKQIKDRITELLVFLKPYDTTEIKYCIRDMQEITAIMESDIGENEKNAEVKKRVKNIFPVHGGLTDFYIWEDDSEKRAAINGELSKLEDDLWTLCENI